MVNEYIVYRRSYGTKSYNVAEKQLIPYNIKEIKGSALARFAEILSDRLIDTLDRLTTHKNIDMEIYYIDLDNDNAILGSGCLLNEGSYESENFKLRIPIQSLIKFINTWLLLENFNIEEITLSRVDNIISISGGALSASTIFARYTYPWEDTEEPCEYITYQRDLKGNYSPVAINLDLYSYPSYQSPIAYLLLILKADLRCIQNLCAKLTSAHFEDMALSSLILQSNTNKINVFDKFELSKNGEVNVISFYKGSLEAFLQNWLLMVKQGTKQIIVSRKDSQISLSLNGISCCQTLKAYSHSIEA